MPLIKQRLSGPDADLLHRRIGGAEITEPRGGLEAHIVGQLDQRGRRRGDELRQPAVRICAHDLLRAAEIALQRPARTIISLAAAAHPARTARAPRIDVDALARTHLPHLLADLGDHAGRIEAENRRQRRHHLVVGRERAEEIADDAREIGNDAAGLDLDQHVRRPRLRHLDTIERHRLTVSVQPRRDHGGHNLLSSLGHTRARPAYPDQFGSFPPSC